jgi:uncharacterized LabA/DUF88 family protein
MATALTAASALASRRSTAHPPAMAFIDAHYFQRAVCVAAGTSPHDKRLDVCAVRDWLLGGWAELLAPRACRRVYWYDGAYDTGHPYAQAQQRFLQAIGKLDLIQPRLGHLADVIPDWHRDVRATLIGMDVDLGEFEARYPLAPIRRQKGVDIMLALDLVRLAERGALSQALLLAGDSDFAPAVELARDAGVLITVIAPERHRPAARLRELADQTIEMPAQTARRMLRTRDGGSDGEARGESLTEDAPAHEPRPKPTRRSKRAGSPDRPALRVISGTAPLPPEGQSAAPAPTLPAPAYGAPTARFAASGNGDCAALAIDTPAGGCPHHPRAGR